MDVFIKYVFIKYNILFTNSKIDFCIAGYGRGDRGTARSSNSSDGRRVSAGSTWRASFMRISTAGTFCIRPTRVVLRESPG